MARTLEQHYAATTVNLVTQLIQLQFEIEGLKEALAAAQVKDKGKGRLN